MNTQTARTGIGTTPWLSLCAVIAFASAASAQTQRYYPPAQGVYPQQPQYGQPPPAYQQPPPSYGYPQQPQTRYENPIEFFPKFSKRMGEMFRRLFYGEDRSGWDYPPQGAPQGGGYSLESRPRQYQTPNNPQQPPPGYYQQPGYQYPPQQGGAQPRYNYPPQQQLPPNSTGVLPPPSNKGNPPVAPGKSTPRTYSPPKLSDSSSSKSRTQSKSTPTPPKPAADDIPPPSTTTARRSESTSPQAPTTAGNSSSGSFLKGRKTGKAGRVISPYPPYKELDVTGLESGSLALDPTTQKVFEVP